jgi:hypothetical protein
MRVQTKVGYEIFFQFVLVDKAEGSEDMLKTKWLIYRNVRQNSAARLRWRPW